MIELKNGMQRTMVDHVMSEQKFGLSHPPMKHIWNLKLGVASSLLIKKMKDIKFVHNYVLACIQVMPSRTIHSLSWVNQQKYLCCNINIQPFYLIESLLDLISTMNALKMTFLS